MESDARHPSRLTMRLSFCVPAAARALVLATATLALFATVPCGQARAADAVLGPEAARTVPITDAHFHLMAWMDVRELAGYMDRNGIRWAGGAGIGGVKSPGAGGPKFAEAIEVLGSRFIRPAGTGPWLSLYHAVGNAAHENPAAPEVQQRLAAIEAELRDRGARVIGEIHANARTTSPEPMVQFKVRADSPTLKALLDLAGRYRRPLNLHAQWDPDTSQEVEQLAASNRGAQLMLAHCGSTADAAAIRRLFERNANVVCDLSARGVPPLHGRGDSFAVYDERGIRGGWKRLIEDYPDRFAVGLDIPQNWEEYEATVRAIRLGLLANLSPSTAEKVAYRNAQAWFDLP
jgi:Tat protein secretion system quality control protein TatD with DNase activity